MVLLSSRRRIVIVLVPIINCIFLILYILKPSSLPTLPASFAPVFVDPRIPKDVANVASTLPTMASSSESNANVLSDNTDGSLDSDGNKLHNDKSYLEMKRERVAHIQLEPLPRHLIDTYASPFYPAGFDSHSSSSALVGLDKNDHLAGVIKKQFEDGEEKEKDEQEKKAEQTERVEQQLSEIEGKRKQKQRHPDEKFLTFLPHSGFHNQRSELENALLLARLLNRTLIMPKVYLGPPMPWMNWNQLHDRLLYQTKIGLEHCRALMEEELLQQSQVGKVNQQQQQHQSEHEQNQEQEQGRKHGHHGNQQQQQLQAQQQRVPDTESSFPPTSEDQFVFNLPIAREQESDIDTDNESRRDLNSYIDKSQSQGKSVNEFIEEAFDEFSMKIDDEGVNIEGNMNSENKDHYDDTETGSKDEDEVADTGEKITVGHQRDFETDKVMAVDQGELEKLPEDSTRLIEQNIAYEDEPEVGIVEDEDEDERDHLAVGDVGHHHHIQQQHLNGRHHHHRKSRSRTRAGHHLHRYLNEKKKLGQDPYQYLLELGSGLRKRSLSEPPELSNHNTLKDIEQRHKRSFLPTSSMPFAKRPWGSKPLVSRISIESSLKGIDGSNKWYPWPAECLGYEGWTMTDWDLFFDLNPLRRFVRIETRTSMTLESLQEDFGIELQSPEEAAEAAATEAEEASAKAKARSGPADGDDESDDKGESQDESEKLEETDSEDVGDDSGEEGSDTVKVSPPLLQRSGQVLYFKDSNLYDYRFTEDADSAESVRTRSKFLQEFTIDWLREQPEKLIHLGSIFGAGRVTISNLALEAQAWSVMVKDHLILRTGVLQSTSQTIVDKIGGTAGFVGIHVRMSDGHFSLTARDTIEQIRKELMWQIGMKDEVDHHHLDHTGDDTSSYRHNVKSELFGNSAHRPQPPASASEPPSSEQQHRRLTVQECHDMYALSAQGSHLSPDVARFLPIYLATDARNPRANPIFDHLFATFDCIFTLQDFESDLVELRQFRNPEDGVGMAKFLIPMVDAMIAAKAGAFFGTPASTFSNYIQKQLRPAYTGLYD